MVVPEPIGLARTVCFKKDQGGMGLRNLRDFHLAMLRKQGWNLIKKPYSLVTRLLMLDTTHTIVFVTTHTIVFCDYPSPI